MKLHSNLRMSWLSMSGRNQNRLSPYKKGDSMMFKEKRVLFSLFLFYFILFVPYTGLAGENPVQFIETTGEAEIVGDNMDMAREKAVQNALYAAIGEGAGMLMDASSIVTDDVLLEKIYTHSQGAVSEYDVIESEHTKNGIYRVRLRVGIQTGKLENSLAELGLLNTIMSHPRIMILPENSQIYDSRLQDAQYHLVAYFTEKKFDVVDVKFPDLEISGNIKKKISRIGVDHQAEIVILYDVETEGSTYDGVMENVPVTLKARAVSTTTKQIMGRGEARATGIGVTPKAAEKEGIQKTSKQVAVKLSKDLASWWRNYTANGIPYIITLKVSGESTQLSIEFQKAITSIPGVVSLTERGSLNGITEMMVKYRFGLAELKSEILSAAENKPGFESIEAVESKGRFMAFAVE